ncbi:MAG: apolipoprotein N-acyltransferase [Verrucomicrobia bacterium]|nr:apolipoprotein N-acyltransferase [Verrucomicrobiota bacterium]
MKRLSIRRLGRGRYLLAALAGLLLAAAFPTFNLAGFAWVAPGLMLAAAAGRPGGPAFRLGYVAGLVDSLASLHWLLFIPFPLGAAAGWLALSAYLALYPGVWVWCCWHLYPHPGATVDLTTEDSLAGVEPARSIMALGWSRRVLWAALCAATWVALEMAVGRFLTGFPWNFLGVSQYLVLPLIQLASVTGVYGVSFLVVWVSVAAGCAVAAAVGRPASRWDWVGELAVPLLVTFAVVWFGLDRLARTAPSGRTLRIALVQPSIPQTLIWDEKENATRFRQILQLSEQALATRPDLLVWPEAALPEFSEDNFRALTNLVAAHRAWMVFGADDAEPSPRKAGGDLELFYNAAFLLDPTGHLAAVYHKQRLVIFGEYVPLARQLPFLKSFTPIQGEFAEGNGPVQFRLTRPEAQCSVLICFEDTFAVLAREAAAPGTDFLLNLTNDGWFGESAEQWQHAVNAAFRAVETGRPLVRCTNNGLSCWIDACGRLHGIYFPGDRNIYRPGVKTARIPLRGRAERGGLTFYGRHGDWFGWGCVGWVAVTCAARFPLRKTLGNSPSRTLE